MDAEFSSMSVAGSLFGDLSMSGMARIAAALAVLIAMLVATGCGAGSGAAVSENPITTADLTSQSRTYTGPPPASGDVAQFKRSVWDNLEPEDRCGGCHGEGGQSPEFARRDDINLAYAAANTVVDLGAPAESRLVTKVAGGHNCWLASDAACADVITRYIQNWAGAEAGNFKTVTLTAPPDRAPGDTKSFPASPQDFANTVYPLLTQHCAGCHRADASTPQAPFFASPDLDTAYAAARSKIDLTVPLRSRLVVRLGSEFHNCWSDCSANAATMEAAIAAFSANVPFTQVDPNLVLSRALRLGDGIVASSGGRFDANAIALWEFKTGSGSTAFDTSGVSPAIDLTLSGDVEWVGGYGIRINSGRAQASTSSSRKLHDLITATGEFSIEAWVAPANVTQDGPAAIVSYSGGTTARNFTLGQTLYNYDALVRASHTDAGGEPAVSTPDGDEALQATLQHVVLTFSQDEGRSLWVNGVQTAAGEPGGGTLEDWDDTFALVLGSEPGGERQWQGVIRLLAIHNRALTPEQIARNFDVGVGARFYLLFGVGDLVGIDDAYILLEASQLDSYAYLFEAPRFVTLSGTPPSADIPISGLRIGINGREVAVGQAYARLNATVSAASWTDFGQPLSSVGTAIGIDSGPDNDEFFLTFERIGGFENVRVPALPPPPAAPADLAPVARIAMRNFAEINATLAALTGVSPAEPEVASVYTTVRQQLPTVEALNTFLSSNQMAVTQLGIEYCNALVDSPSLRSALFPGFDFGAGVDTAFDATGRSSLIDPLSERLLATLPTQPDGNEIRTELGALIDRLANCSADCTPARTRTIAKATCAAALSNAAMLIQ